MGVKSGSFKTNLELVHRCQNVLSDSPLVLLVVLSLIIIHLTINIPLCILNWLIFRISQFFRKWPRIQFNNFSRWLGSRTLIIGPGSLFCVCIRGLVLGNFLEGFGFKWNGLLELKFNRSSANHLFVKERERSVKTGAVLISYLIFMCMVTIF